MNERQSIFTDQDMAVENYSRFSVVSLILFVLAIIVSAIIVVNKFVIPVGLILAFFTFSYLAFIAISKKNYMGTILSWMALFMLLAACSGSWAYNQYRFQHLTKVARKHANEYFELVKENRMHEAYQMTLNYNYRTKPGTDLIQRYGTLEQPGTELKVFLKQHPEIDIRKTGEKTKLIPFGLMYLKSKGKETIAYRYKFVSPDEGGQDRIFDIRMVRFDYPTPPGPQWYVEGFVNIQPNDRRVSTSQQRGEEKMPDDF